MIKRPTCDTCTFWNMNASGKFGECRRHPPTDRLVEYPAMPENNYHYAAHPGTAPDHWCGEHKGVKE